MSEFYNFSAEQAATSALAAVQYQSVAGRLATTEISKEFKQGKGDTVTFSRPVICDPARTYTDELRSAGTPITYSDFSKAKVPVTLDTILYNAAELPDEVDTWDISNLEQEIVAPLATTIAEAIDATVVEALTTVPAGLTKADSAAKGKYVGADGTAYDSIKAARDADTEIVSTGVGTKVKAANLTAKTHEDVQKVIRTAKRLLDDRGISKRGRVLAVGSAWAQALVGQPNILKANESASDGALREATVGRIFGFDVVEVDGLDANAAYAYHPEGLGLALAVPRIPKGVSFGKSIKAGGFAVRYIHDYDPDFMQDRAVLSVFAGAEVLDPQRIVALTGTDGFEEPAAPADAASASE